MKGNQLLIGVASLVLLAAHESLGACVAVPSGLVAWWQAESNQNDSVNLNIGDPGGAGFALGKAGQAFNFNGTNAAICVPKSPSLNVGTNTGFSIELWIRPADVSQPHPLLQWNSGPMYTAFGVSVWISVPPANGGTGPGCLLVDIKDTKRAHGVVCTAPGVVSLDTWQHVAATYDYGSGVAALYHDGNLLLQTNLGIVTPYTAADLWIGYERDQLGNDLFYSIGGGQAWYAGLMDELSIYSRALSISEIQSICNAGASGKCAVAPTAVTIQPASQSVAEGELGVFSVQTSGSPPLSYEWRFNGTPIAGATNMAMSITHVQLTNGGSYSVRVTNAAGSVISAEALLTVVPSYVPTWTQTTVPTNLGWTGLACSADGEKVVATSYEGFIYTSNDGGKHWVSNDVPLLTWYDVTSSSDGVNLAAAALTLANYDATPGAIYISTNSGATWQQSASDSYGTIAGSQDGKRLIASVTYDRSHAFTSSDGGKTWSKISTPGYGPSWFACSADGTRIIAADYMSDIYRSVDSGATWSITSAPNSDYWIALASSASGSSLYAADVYTGAFYHSANSGVTWYSTGAPKLGWADVACSADGTKLVAADNGLYPAPGGYLYVSTDSGTNWVATRAPLSRWSNVASSSDGTRLFAAQWPGSIYVWRPTELNIVLTNATILITWPTNVPGFILQQEDLMSSGSWVNLTNVPSVIDAQYQVSLPAEAVQRAFRLMYP